MTGRTRSQLGLRAFIGLLGVSMILAACRPQSTKGSATPGSEIAQQNAALLAIPPAETRKAVMDSLTAPTNILVNPPSYTGRIVRNALWVHFKSDAPVAARARALTRVSGEVIGGHRIAGGGYYLVKIPTPFSPGDSSSGPLLRARRSLDLDPSIRSTLIFEMDRQP